MTRCVLLALGLGLTLAATAYGQTAVDAKLGAPFAQKERPTLGAEGATIQVIEVRAFDCDHCQAFHAQAFPTLRERFVDSGLVAWTMLDTALDPKADRTLLKVAHCLRKRGHYWDSHELFFADHFSTAFLIFDAADRAGVEPDAFKACVNDPTIQELVESDFAEVAKLKIRQLPTFLLRKKRWDGLPVEVRLEGEQTVESLQRAIERLKDVR
ncbi:MAG: thioredoxin domain-containing protein [Verrucomicrobiota bacterium JB022]|nr:thioredoxin domain-containing protein [Verrucomicrobiota bacterium JB022]